MSEWLLERGIGETRAVRIENGVIVELRIERESAGPRHGDIWDARLTTKLSQRRGIVDIGGNEAILEPLPAGLSEGGLVRVEVVREPLPERGRPRLAKVREAGDAGSAPGCVTFAPGLADSLVDAVVCDQQGLDRLEALGWSEAMDEASNGRIDFAGGALAIAPTPAMTTIDVDGVLLPAELALLGAHAAALAIVKFDIGGSIGIDLPTVGDKTVRNAAAAVFDDLLPKPFERTAVNGFGFIQIVRPRRRASIIELVQATPVETAGLALLRSAERSTGVGERRLTAHPRVTAWLSAHAGLLAELALRLGTSVALSEDTSLPLSGGHVHAIQI